MIANRTDRIALTRAFNCSMERLWHAITDPAELSEWLGGECSIDAHVGGDVRFDVPGDDIHATGTVRWVAVPRTDHSVALLEHTFVDAANAGVTSVCRWAVRGEPSGCELVFTHDGFGEADRDRLEALWRSGLDTAIEQRGLDRIPTPLPRAIGLLKAARRILLVSFIGPEVPETLLDAGFESGRKRTRGPTVVVMVKHSYSIRDRRCPTSSIWCISTSAMRLPSISTSRAHYERKRSGFIRPEPVHPNRTTSAVAGCRRRNRHGSVPPRRRWVSNTSTITTSPMWHARSRDDDLQRPVLTDPF